MKEGKLYFLIVVGLAVVFTLAVPPEMLARAGEWSVGVANVEGSFTVEDDAGSDVQITDDVGFTSRYWFDDSNALRLSGNFQTAGDQNFQFGASYLAHLTEGNVRPYVGGGFAFADDAVSGDNYIALEAQGGVLWELENSPLSFSLSTDLLTLTVDPETDVYAAKSIVFEFLYSF